MTQLMYILTNICYVPLGDERVPVILKTSVPHLVTEIIPSLHFPSAERL